MRFTHHAVPLSRIRSWILGLAVLLAPGVAAAQLLQNTATGTSNGVVLDTGSSTVNLTRAGAAVTSVVAEISPNDVIAGVTAHPFVYDILPEINPGDSGVERIEILAPAGYANLSATDVRIDGTPLANNCPSPGAGEYCATVALNALAVTLGQKVTFTGTNIRIGFTADTPASTGTADFNSSVVDGALPKQNTIPGDADGDAADENSITVQVLQTQGIVLDLIKTANKREAFVGGIVTYTVTIENTQAADVLQVRVEDTIPPNFKYVAGSARLEGGPMSEPTGNRKLVFDIGTVPGRVDADGDGELEPDEPGHMTLAYQLVVGSGAIPGDFTNTVVAKDVCATCVVSNRTSATVEIGLDPLFDLGTIIGKVFEDRNRNDWQDPGEPGVPDAMVALDDGTYALTDEHGRYHFPAVEPGHRMLKINLHSLPPGTLPATDRSRIVWLTPGLMVKANFGVLLRHDTESVGRPAVPGVAVSASQSRLPIEIQGSAETFDVLINGRELLLPASDVRLTVGRLDESIQIVGQRLEEPVRFALEVDDRSAVLGWTLSIMDGMGGVLRTIAGDDVPPEAAVWDGRTENGALVDAGEIYQFQLDVRYRDGSSSTSPRRLLGVNRTNAITLDLLGDAFETAKAKLSPKAKAILDEAAEVLREYPDEKVVIEGHTDSVGSREYNLDLSRRRATAALDYLVERQELPRGQFAVYWHGEERPIAPNDLEEGRALNRRVEIKGEVEREETALVLDHYRSRARASVDGRSVDLETYGRFATEVGADRRGPVEIELEDSAGRSVRTSVPLPDIEITAPTGQLILGQGASEHGCSVSAGPVVRCRLAGRTQPGNSVELDGRSLETADDGSFDAEVEVRPGRTVLGLVARNAEGGSRIANLGIHVSDRDSNGELLLVADAVPGLTVKLPPKGKCLTNPRLTLEGITDPDNRLTVNGRDFAVGADGRFVAKAELPRGKSRLVVEATNPQGRVATIEREVEVAKHELFLLAFADGKFGRMSGDGFIEGAGLDEDDDYYTEGRVAFYLKGVIKGKYLITSAFDSGKDEVESLFEDLDGEASNRLLTNLDPDKFYPVYGDSSTVVYDAQSEGKLYLSLDSDEIHLLLGNYALSLDDTELAAYRRTLYGGHFTYQSASRTRYGASDTEVALFVSDVRRSHVRDELRATGGSVYYLSHREVVEGSEEVTLFVRDKDTGLLLSQQPQRQNVDYVIKYEEGRIMFQRPISSVADSGSIVDQELLPGHEVYIHVDYETLLNDFEKTGSGGRLRRQIGDHVSVGATYIDDEADSGAYELSAVDAELRLGENTRLTAEYADSQGTDSRTFISDDGGLTYTAAPSSGAFEGSAWKASAELDVGEWFDRPGRYRVNVYYKDLEPGFFSSNSAQEHGTEKLGLHADLELTGQDSIRLRHDFEERSGGGPYAVAAGETTLSSVQWHHTRERWGLVVELFDTESEDDLGNRVSRSRMGATRLWSRLTEKLEASLEHQESFSGIANDQTSLGIEFQALPSLALAFEGMHGTQGQSASGGAILTLGESRVYLTERVDEARSGRRKSTVLGSSTPLGRSSKVYTEYQVEESPTGEKAISLVGLQRQWNAAPGFRFLLAGEVADTDSGDGSDRRSAVSAGLSYSRPESFTASSRQEVRFEDGSKSRMQLFSVNQLDYRLNPDFTMLLRYRYSKTRDRELNAVDARFEERSLGLAFRPVGNDRFNSLARYTRLFDQRPITPGALESSDTMMEVFSMGTVFDVTRRVEWLGKGALRRQEERVGDLPRVETKTYLTIQRLNFNVWKPIDLGLEYRILTQREADDRREGWLGELTWEVIRSFRVGVGYNFTDFSDDEFSNNDYSVEGWFFRVQGRY